MTGRTASTRTFRGGAGAVVAMLALATACARPAPETPPEPAARVPSPRIEPVDSEVPAVPVEAAFAAEPTRPAPLLPAHRVVAYYGNPLSARMGILGRLPPDSMARHLETQAAAFERADPAHPVLPALHLVTVVAQPHAGADSLYRLSMPDSIIERVADWAEARGWLLILDIQPGRAGIRDEVKRLLPMLRRDYVHLALDPEFAMGEGGVPGTRIGTLDARDVNVAVELLAALVDEDLHLPPKLLIVHRFTTNMLTGVDRIREDPRVQVIINMDGFGAPHLKRDSYRACVKQADVPWAGFKLFYEQDVPLMTPEDVLRLDPAPLFVVYQ